MVARKLKITQKTNLKDKKTGRGSKTAEYLSDLKVMGDEPSFTSEPTDIEYLRALNWYNVMYSKDSAKKFTVEYLQSKNRFEEATKIKQIPDCWFPVHMGWIARMHLRGVKLKQRSLIAFEKLLDEAMTKIPDEKPKNNVVAMPVENKFQERVGDVIFALDKMVDEKGYNTFSVFEWLRNNEIQSSLIPYVIKHYEPIEEEVSQVNANRTIGSSCPADLKEGYSKYTKTQLKEMKLHYIKLLFDLNQYIDNKKKQKQQTKVRKPRVKKIVPVEKKLKNFKFQKESNEYRLVSINPTKIFESRELIMFNTKYKTLTILRTDGIMTLDVKGLAFINIDETNSRTYRIGRNTEKTLEQIGSATKRQLDKLLPTLKEIALNNRTNEHCILMKVF